MKVLFLGYKVYKAFQQKTETGREGLKGETGIAKTKITSTEGKVFVHGEIWDAEAPENIPKGSKVKVVEVLTNLKIRVTKV